MDDTEDRIEMVIDELEQVEAGLADILRTALDLNLVPTRKQKVAEARERVFQAYQNLQWVLKDIKIY